MVAAGGFAASAGLVTAFFARGEAVLAAAFAVAGEAGFFAVFFAAGLAVALGALALVAVAFAAVFFFVGFGDATEAFAALGLATLGFGAALADDAFAATFVGAFVAVLVRPAALAAVFGDFFTVFLPEEVLTSSLGVVVLTPAVRLTDRPDVLRAAGRACRGPVPLARCTPALAFFACVDFRGALRGTAFAALSTPPVALAIAARPSHQGIRSLPVTPPSGRGYASTHPVTTQRAVTIT